MDRRAALTRLSGGRILGLVLVVGKLSKNKLPAQGFTKFPTSGNSMANLMQQFN